MQYLRRTCLTVVCAIILVLVPVTVASGATATSTVFGALSYPLSFSRYCPATVRFAGSGHWSKSNGTYHRVRVELYADGELVASVNKNRATSARVIRGSYISPGARTYQVVTWVYWGRTSRIALARDESLTYRSRC